MAADHWHRDVDRVDPNPNSNPNPNPSPTWESSGRMVTPAWPPTTGTVTSTGSTPRTSATNASARTTSSFVTPSSLSGLYVPAAQAAINVRRDREAYKLTVCSFQNPHDHDSEYS